MTELINKYHKDFSESVASSRGIRMIVPGYCTLSLRVLKAHLSYAKYAVTTVTHTHAGSAMAQYLRVQIKVYGIHYSAASLMCSNQQCE